VVYETLPVATVLLRDEWLLGLFFFSAFTFFHVFPLVRNPSRASDRSLFYAYPSFYVSTSRGCQVGVSFPLPSHRELLETLYFLPRFDPITHFAFF